MFVSRIAVAIVSLAIGGVVGIVLLVGFCSIPGLAFSVACGHNAYIWLPVFLPIGVGGCWFLLTRLFSTKSSGEQTAVSPALFKCGSCGALVPYSAASCPECGFVYGSANNAA